MPRPSKPEDLCGSRTQVDERLMDNGLTRQDLSHSLMQHQKAIADLERRFASQIHALEALLNRGQLLPQVGVPAQAYQSSSVHAQNRVMDKEGASMAEEELMEFATEMVSRHGSMQAAFAALDTNGNGMLGLHEFRDGLATMGYTGNADIVFHSLTKHGVMRIGEFEHASDYVKVSELQERKFSPARRLSMITSEKFPEQMQLCLRKLRSKCGLNQSGVISNRVVASLLQSSSDYSEELGEPIHQILQALDAIGHVRQRFRGMKTKSTSLCQTKSATSGALTGKSELSVPLFRFAELLLLENVREVFPSMEEPVVNVVAKIRAAVFDDDPAQIIISAMDLTLSDLEEERTSWFDYLLDLIMSVVIVANSISIGLLASYHTSEKWGLPTIIEIIFTTIFTVELTMRMIRTGPRKLFFRTGWRWAWFDAVMIFLALSDLMYELVCSAASCDESNLDTSSVMGLRLFRLLRIARLVRLLKLSTFRELRLLLSGIEGLSRTLLCATFVLLLTVYFLGVLMTQSMGDSRTLDVNTRSQSFSDVATSMYTVFRCLMVGDCAAADGTPLLLHLVEDGGWVYGVAYCMCCVVVNFGFASLLTALVVDSTLTAAKLTDFKQSMKAVEKRKVGQKVNKLTQVFRQAQSQVNKKRGHSSDPNQSLFMERNSFIEVAGYLPVKRIFDDLDIDEVDRLDLFDTLDSDGNGRVDLEELVAGILKMRGDARKADVVATRLMIAQLVGKIASLEESVRSGQMEVIDALTASAVGML